MQISTIVKNLDQFDKDKFLREGISIEVQAFPQRSLNDDYGHLLDQWSDKLKGFNLPLSLHGSSFDLNPGSNDKRILEVTKFRYLQSIEIAKVLGVRYVVFHSQVNPLLSVKRIRNMKLMNQITFWKDMFNNHIPEDMVILLENEYDESFEDIKTICDGVANTRLGVCLDIGHSLAYSQLDLEEWIKGLGSRIRYIHLHWNDGSSDSHLPPSKSQILYLRDLLKKYAIDPIITQEYYKDNQLAETKRIQKILMKP